MYIKLPYLFTVHSYLRLLYSSCHNGTQVKMRSSARKWVLYMEPCIFTNTDLQPKISAYSYAAQAMLLVSAALTIFAHIPHVPSPQISAFQNWCVFFNQGSWFPRWIGCMRLLECLPFFSLSWPHEGRSAIHSSA